ncbi:unnamed protein product [Mytilus coruscus]|uniref:SRCR domain-containing protein n=1 Tax=Mytilus coruscus TaxID=42192 RepID=A0A6J8DTK4_MYTCO|nr:unnamed protein product [Mytilus coruscus]
MMVRTRINKVKVVMFVLEYTLLCYALKTEQIILCEQDHEKNEKLYCPNGTTIFSKSITIGNTWCNPGNNHETCMSNVERNFDTKCFDKNNCTLSSQILSEGSCQRKPKYLNVVFQCKSWVWHKFDRSPTNVYTCANHFTEIRCPRFTFVKPYYIHIISVQFRNDRHGECKAEHTDCGVTLLRRLCDKKWQCELDTSGDLCLFNHRFASISYWCRDPTVTFGTPTIPTINPSHSTSDNEIEIHTTTIKNDGLPAIYMDTDGRVIYWDPSSQTENYICSVGWDEVDAIVLCQSLNNTWIGNSTVGEKISDFLIVPISFNCNGNETNLFHCNFTLDEQKCMTSKVAVARCCQDTGSLNECVITPSNHKTSSDISASSPLDMFVRDQIENSKISWENTKMKALSASNSTNTPKKEDGTDYSHPSKETESPYALSEDGVYDKTNEKRHVVKGTEKYSRTVDTVYDSSEQHMRQERKEGTYDHVFGQKTEDYYDQTTRI